MGVVDNQSAGTEAPFSDWPASENQSGSSEDPFSEWKGKEEGQKTHCPGIITRGRGVSVTQALPDLGDSQRALRVVM